MAVYYFYKICSLDNKYIYIGSTTDFNKRMYNHKSDCFNECSKKFNYKLYKTIRENNGIENFIFEMIESITTDDKEIVLKHEQELMIKYNSNLNTYRSFISNEQKKAEIKINKKQYYNINKDQIKEKHKTKYICDCGNEYTYGHKSEHFKSRKHKLYEQTKQNNITNNITYNITNLTIQK